MFVFSLHVIDVMSDARHGRQGHDYVRIAGRLRSVAMFDDVLQQQVVLEDALDRFEQVRAKRQRVLQLRLSLPTRPAGRLVPHQICQHRHFPGVVGAVVGVDGEAGIIANKTAGYLDGIESARLQLRQELAIETVNVINIAK